MEYLILAISTICSCAACVMSYLAYDAIIKNKLSVPDTQVKPALAKELSEEESKEKWMNLKQAFNLSGKNNGRSQIS